MAEEQKASIRDRIAENYPDALCMDGYDDCILGMVRRYGMEPVVLYDEQKVYQKLMADGMTYEEAVEWFEFNQIGAWNGEYTPCFMTWMTQYRDGKLPVIDEVEDDG